MDLEHLVEENTKLRVMNDSYRQLIKSRFCKQFYGNIVIVSKEGISDLVKNEKDTLLNNVFNTLKRQNKLINSSFEDNVQQVFEFEYTPEPFPAVREYKFKLWMYKV